MKLIRQTETSECGLACLAMVAGHYGYHVDLADLRRRFLISAKGATLAQLIRHAASMQLAARPLRVELDMLQHLKTPCILHWNLNHFVVLKKVCKNLRGNVTVTILDPAKGERRLPLHDISDNFTGVAMELSPNPDFAAKDERKHLSIRDLTGRIFGLRRAVVQVMALAIALEVFAICAPLFNQFVIDEVIVGGDRELLSVLVIGFALMLIVQTAISLARSWFLMRWSVDIGFQWSTRVFSHLCRLPSVYFEKRHLGDIVSRFGSIGAIQGTLTSLFVESALDGLMALLALCMMLLYSPKLSLVVIAAVAAYVLLRWFFYYPFREASQERLVLAAKENTHFLESMRAVMPVKLFGQEAQRCARWQNLKQDVINRDVETQKLGIVFKIGNTAIFGAQGLAVFYLGAGMVMQSSLTVGMLMAFSSYASTFSGRLFSLVDLVVNLRMLSMHGARLADIVLEPVEEETEMETDISRLDHSISLRNIRFRYADGEPWLLNGVDLIIPAGQSISIIGASGCGKTTLCKIILGLLQPTEGEVLIGGIPVTRLGLKAYRQLIGTVMQDDSLLSGSILDNISFFNPQVGQEQIQHCARLAAIHDDIVAMPMGYQTLIGDMGSSLSGGQKQRILLARALCKQPKLLALDEATSHLDVANEHRVNHALAQLQLTRIVIAHRPEAINASERIVAIENGKIVELKSANAGLVA
jgi:ATP-binding cassette subfamily B protein RaxB